LRFLQNLNQTRFWSLYWRFLPLTLPKKVVFHPQTLPRLGWKFEGPKFNFKGTSTANDLTRLFFQRKTNCSSQFLSTLSYHVTIGGTKF
jgi:hypothetical protein